MELVKKFFSSFLLITFLVGTVPVVDLQAARARHAKRPRRARNVRPKKQRRARTRRPRRTKRAVKRKPRARKPRLLRRRKPAKKARVARKRKARVRKARPAKRARVARKRKARVRKARPAKKARVARPRPAKRAARRRQYTRKKPTRTPAPQRRVPLPAPPPPTPPTQAEIAAWVSAHQGDIIRRPVEASMLTRVKYPNVVQGLTSLSTVSTGSMLARSMELDEATANGMGMTARFDRVVPEFQLSLSLPATATQLDQDIPSNLSVIRGIPVIGHYRGSGYNYRTRLALIALPAHMLSLPVGLVYRASQALGVPIATIDQPDMQRAALLGSGKNIQAYVMIHGQVIELNDNPQDHNIAYHPWIVPLRGDGSGLVPDNVAQDIRMGIFGANGVQALSGSDSDNTGGPIAFNQFKVRNVNWHDGRYMSPNNARLRIESGRGISTFWSTAISPDSNDMIIVYHIFANDNATEAALVNSLYVSNTLGDLFTQLGLAVGTLDSAGATADADALRQVVANLR